MSQRFSLVHSATGPQESMPKGGLWFALTNLSVSQWNSFILCQFVLTCWHTICYFCSHWMEPLHPLFTRSTTIHSFMIRSPVTYFIWLVPYTNCCSQTPWSICYHNPSSCIMMSDSPNTPWVLLIQGRTFSLTPRAYQDFWAALN